MPFKDPEKQRLSNLASYHRNKEERLQTRKLYRLNHSDEERAYRTEYNNTHREERREKSRIYDKEHHEEKMQRGAIYRENNRETLRVKGREYYAKNPERFKIWYLNNKEKQSQVIRTSNKRRRAYKANAPRNDFTHAQWVEMQAAYDHRCAYCKKRCKGHLTQDHLTPLSKGGSHTASNIIPACFSCNSKKHTGNVLQPVQPLLLTIAPAKPRKTRKKK